MEPWKLIVILVFCLVLRGFSVAVLTPQFNAYYVDLAGQTAMNLAIFILCVQQFGINKARILTIFGRLRPIDLATGLALAVTALLFTFGESALSTLVIAQFDLSLAYELGNFHEQVLRSHAFFSTHVLLFVAANVVLPAIVEEFFFRGLLFPTLAARRTFLRSALICSAIFTVLHFSKVIVVNTFIFAFVLCCLYARHRSLYSCIIMHASYNLMAFISQHYFDFHRTRSVNQLSSVFDWLPQLCMLVAAVFILGALAYRHRSILFLKDGGWRTPGYNIRTGLDAVGVQTPMDTSIPPSVR